MLFILIHRTSWLWKIKCKMWVFKSDCTVYYLILKIEHLAYSWVLHNLQTVHTHASGAHRPCSWLLVRHGYTATADLSGRRRLWSANTLRYELPLLKRKFGERSSSYHSMPNLTLGMTFLLVFRNLRTLVLSKSNWKLVCLHFHIKTDIHDFVEAPHWSL